MAVPKAKTSKSKTRSRRSANVRVSGSARSVCPQCDTVKAPHRVCPECGYYGGRYIED